MNDQRRTEIKVGIIVLIGIIVFIWILGWAKNFNLTSSEKSLLVKFDDVSGLEIGDYVTVNGVKKGHVEDFNINGDNVVVKLSIDANVKLKNDAQFQVTMLDLMGGKKVNIIPGVSSEPLDYSEIQSGIFLADIPKVMSILGNVENDILVIVNDIKLSLKSLNNYLNDSKFNTDIKSSISNLNKASTKLNLLLDENREGIKQLTSNTVELTQNVNDLISENKESLKISINNIQTLIKKTDDLISKANSFTDEIKNKQNNIGKILYDDELYKNLTQSLSQLNELTKILINQLKTDGVNVDAHIF